MPFQSEAQRRYLYSQHPEIAAEFEAHTPKGKKLPKRKKKRKNKELGTVSGAAGGPMVGYPSLPRKKRKKKRRHKAAHPWLVKAMGRFDPQKHPRDHGKFSAGGGTSAAPGSRHNPDLDAAMGMQPNRPAGPPPLPRAPAPPKPSASRPNLARQGGDPFTEYQPGSQDLKQHPAKTGPHVQTQQAALHAARNVRPGDRASHAAAVQALDAHLKAGLAELHRRAQTAGPRAGNMYRRAAQQFKEKLSAARAKVDQLAGRGPPPLRGRGQEYRLAPGSQPPPVPRRPGQGPPPLADRGRVRPFVRMGLHPWLAVQKHFDIDLEVPK